MVRQELRSQDQKPQHSRTSDDGQARAEVRMRYRPVSPAGLPQDLRAGIAVNAQEIKSGSKSVKAGPCDWRVGVGRRWRRRRKQIDAAGIGDLEGQFGTQRTCGTRPLASSESYCEW